MIIYTKPISIYFGCISQQYQIYNKINNNINNIINNKHSLFVEIFVDLCVGCLKCVYFMFSHCMGLLHLAIGISSIVISAIVQKRMNQAFDYFNAYEGHIGQSMMIAMWILSSFIMFGGIMGLICCSKKPFICQLIPMCLQLVYGIFALQLVNTINDMKNENCLKPQWSENLEQANIWAQQELCQSDCQCQSLRNLQSFMVQKIIPQPQLYQSKFMQNVTKVQNCKNLNLQNYIQQIEFLSYAESKFKCSGWCSKQKYYLFSDINQLISIAEAYVIQMLCHILLENLNLLGVFSLSVMGFEAFVILISCFAICCVAEAVTDINNALL